MRCVGVGSGDRAAVSPRELPQAGLRFWIAIDSSFDPFTIYASYRSTLDASPCAAWPRWAFVV
jgi:hypothetical protein